MCKCSSHTPDTSRTFFTRSCGYARSVTKLRHTQSAIKAHITFYMSKQLTMTWRKLLLWDILRVLCRSLCIAARSGKVPLLSYICSVFFKSMVLLHSQRDTNLKISSHESLLLISYKGNLVSLFCANQSVLNE